MPATAKRPADHLPAKSEAEGRDVEFEFRGEPYAITRDRADDLELFELIEDEKYVSAIRGFLGPDQWAHFKEVAQRDEGRVSMAVFQEFLDAAMEAMGGNS